MPVSDAQSVGSQLKFLAIFPNDDDTRPKKSKSASHFEVVPDREECEHAEPKRLVRNMPGFISFFQDPKPLHSKSWNMTLFMGMTRCRNIDVTFNKGPDKCRRAAHL